VGAKADAYRAIRTLADSGLAVVMVSSELAELVALCDRIVVLADGRVTATVDGRTATEADLLVHALPATAGTRGTGDEPDAGPRSDTDSPEPDPDRTEAAAP